ncbi:hypothetical protein B0T21DRAFT_278443 [Apiosordaria backusii]|uniref:Uncharacterized protein n=1 Tax=Apiosordaria backusii TaxID=314023 RepID=A0AA40EY09_9PEZI|nr:hypothetical protein B0T21DRAFT_278443 [Apiosordaria backusii]
MDEEHTITLNLGSSPDPLIDPILSPPMLPPSRVKPRAQPAARLLSIARSPRKRTFELDIGSPVSPQRLLVTVQAEDEVRNTKGIKRRLFQSPTPTPKRGMMRGGDVTTTVVPVRGLTDDEGVTPRRRGRPRKSGTPVPTTRRKRPGTPGAKAAGTRASQSPQKEPPPSEDALEDIDATPRASGLLRRPAKRKSMTPAKDDTQPRKRGRPRKSQVTMNNMGSIAEVLQQDNASLPPIQQDFFNQGRHETGEDQRDDGAGGMEDDIWLATLSDQPSPAAQRLQTSRNNRSPPKEASPEPAPQPEPEPEPQTDPAQSEGDFNEHHEWADMHDGPEDDFDEGDYMTSPVRDVGDAQDTVAAGAEDFTEVPLAELQSIIQMNSSVMAGSRLEERREEELGDATKVIIKNTMDYLRQSRGSAAGESSVQRVEETRREHDFGFSVGPEQTSRLEPAEARKRLDFGSSVGLGQTTQLSHIEQLKEIDFNFSVGPGQTTQQSPTVPRKEFDFEFSVLPGETIRRSPAKGRRESAFNSSVGPREAKASEKAVVPRREVLGFGSSIGPIQRTGTASFEAKNKPFDPEFFSDESRQASEEPRQETEEPRQENEEPRQETEEPAQHEHYSRSRTDPDFEFSDEPPEQQQPQQFKSYKRVQARNREAEAEPEDELADDSDAWWNRVSEKPKPKRKPKSLLRDLIRKAAPQRTETGNTTQEPSPADDSNLSGEGDSFSTLPDEVLAAATPRRYREPQPEDNSIEEEPLDDTREEEPHDDKREQEAQAASQQIQPSIERPSPVNHSNPHLDTNRLLTPDETPSPIPSEAEGGDEDAGTIAPTQPTQPDVQVEMPSSPPPVARLPQHARTKSNETPADQLLDIVSTARADVNVQSLNLAPPGPQARPSLSPIVRAGRVLQLVTSDPPSPPGRDSVLRSPFRGSVGKSSQSPAPFISQPRATRSPSPQHTDTAQEQPDRPWLRGLQQIKNFVAETAKSLSPSRISGARREPEEDPFGPNPTGTPTRSGSVRNTVNRGPDIDRDATVSAPNSAAAEPVRRRAIQERPEPAQTNDFGFRRSFTYNRGQEASDRRRDRETARLPAKEPEPQPEPEPFPMDDIKAPEPEQPAQPEEDDADFWLEAGGVTPFAPRIAPPQVKTTIPEPRQRSKIPTSWRRGGSEQQKDDKENQLRQSRRSQIDEVDEVEEESSFILEQLDKRPAAPVQPTPAAARANLDGFFSSPALFPGQETPGMGLFKPPQRQPKTNLVQQQQQRERQRVRQPDNSLFAHLIELEEQEPQNVVPEVVPEKQSRFSSGPKNPDLLARVQEDDVERRDVSLKGKEKERGQRSSSTRAQEIIERRAARREDKEKEREQTTVTAPRPQDIAEQENTNWKGKEKEPEPPAVSAPRLPSPTDSQTSFGNIPQKQNFTPRKRQFGENTLFQPQAQPAKPATSATNNVLNPDNSQVDRFFQESRQLIQPQKHRRQRVRAQNAQQISSEVFSSPKTTPPRHEPNREASPGKSCLRSPLKGKTPGRLVEFTSSTLSPLAQADKRAERRKSPEKTAQSQRQRRGVGEVGSGGQASGVMNNRRQEQPEKTRVEGQEVNYPELPEPQPDAEKEKEMYDIEREGDPFSDTPHQRREREVREQQDRQAWEQRELGPPLHYTDVSKSGITSRLFEHRLHQAKARQPEQHQREETYGREETVDDEYDRGMEEQQSEPDWLAYGEQQPDQNQEEDYFLSEQEDEEPTPPLSQQDQHRYDQYQPQQARDHFSYRHQNHRQQQEYDEEYSDEEDQPQYSDHEQEQPPQPTESFFPKFSFPTLPKPSLPSLPNPLSLLPSIPSKFTSFFSSTAPVPDTQQSTTPPAGPDSEGWAIPHWELLADCLTLHRQHLLPLLPLSQQSKSLVGLVLDMGEPQEEMSIEVWHMQIVEYFKHKVLADRGEGRDWDEWKLVRRLFAVLIGEMRRRDKKGMEERRRRRGERQKERERERKRQGKGRGRWMGGIELKKWGVGRGRGGGVGGERMWLDRGVG